MGCISYYTKGRFANNCFVAMAAWVYAKKHGLEFHVPKESIAPNVWPSNFQHLSNQNWNPNIEIVEVNDEGHRYRELPFKEEWRDKNIMIGTKSIETGYFQSYKYLEGHEDEIRKVFFDDKTIYKYPGIVAIHWRLGDYRQFTDKHPLVTKEYIFKAIQLICFLTKNQEYHYRFFSDEPYFVFEFASKYLSNHSVSVSKNRSDEEDFIEMMGCDHQIVANSSYSVLSAILNPNKKKIVICADESCYMGVNNKHLDVTDMMPKEWIRLKF